MNPHALTTACEATGALVLVPTPLDFGEQAGGPLDAVLPAHTIARASGLTTWICENAKTTRAFLQRVAQTHALALPLQQQHIMELPRAVHKRQAAGSAFDPRPWLAAAQQGQDIGLISEAGMPAIADPGESVVAAAHELGLRVEPLVGPVSITLALAASGLNGQHFAFVGYLPQEPAARNERIRALEQSALRLGQTQLFIETPYRNTALWSALLQNLQPKTRLCLALGLTLPRGRVWTRSVDAWRTRPAPALDAPALFALGL